jgi:hypothetical protein
MNFLTFIFDYALIFFTLSVLNISKLKEKYPQPREKLMKPFLYSICLQFILVFSSYSLDLESASAPFAQIDPLILKLHSYPIASPLKGGPVRILFIGKREETGFSASEIVMRLDCEAETVLTDSRTHMGTSEPWIRFQPLLLSKKALTEKTLSLISKKWDIIWIDYDISVLDESIRKELFGKIQTGCGLIYIGNKKDIRSFISRGKFNEKLFDTVSYGGVAKPEYIGNMGKGIVFNLPSLYSSFTIQDVGDYFAQAVHIIMLSLGRPSSLEVTDREKPLRNIELEAMSIMNFRIEISNSGETAVRDVIVRYRDRNGKITHESRNSYTLEEGKTYLRIRYPMLPVGKYSLDISVLDGDNVIVLAGTSINVISDETISEITLWDKKLRVGQYVSGSIKTKHDIKEGMDIRAELLDQWGKQVGFSELLPEAGRRSVDFTFKIPGQSRGSMTLRVTFYKNNLIAQVIEKTILLKHEFNPGKFSFIVNGGRSFDPWQFSGYDRMIKAGVTDFAWEMAPGDAGSFMSVSEKISRQGVSVVPILNASGFFNKKPPDGKKTKEGNSRQVPINVLSVIDTLRSLDTPALWIKASHSPLFWGGNDTQQAPSLSEAWKTGDFGKWLVAERDRMEISLKNAGEIAQTAIQADSTAKVGISGYSPYLESFRGFRSSSNIESFPGFSMYPQESGFCFSGAGGILLSLSLFKQPGSLSGLITGGESFRRGNEPLLRAAPWQSLFLGLNSIFWSDGFGGTNAAVAPGLNISPAFSLVAEETKEIMGGIDLLLSEAKRHSDGVAVVYSPLSILSVFTSEESSVDYCKGEYNGSENNKASVAPFHPDNAVLRSAQAFLQACMDAGYSPSVISEDQILTPWLKDKGIRILYLPYMQALSSETASRIEDFTKNGGTVIADVRTGIMDEHLAMNKTGRLDSLFGITQNPERKPKVIEGVFEVNGKVEGLIPGFKVDFCRGENNITVSGGAKVLGTISGNPALIVNSVSGGRAIFLNIEMGQYNTLRNKGTETDMRTLISWCLRNGGIGAPTLTISDSAKSPAGRIQSAIFEDGSAWYLGLLLDPGTADIPNKQNQSCNVSTNNLAKSAFFYDVRSGDFIGAGNSFSENLIPGEAKLIALMPYRVRDIDIKFEKNVINHGESIKYRVTIVTQGDETKAGRHVFHISVFEPDGRERHLLSDSISAPKGSGAGVFEIMPDAPSGKWKMKVKDMATGKSSEAIFMVMPSNK